MRILIAEDDAVSRRLLRGTLEKLGHDVTEAVTGSGALERFEEAEFPIVITDWMMPEMDGVELVRRIRAKNLINYVYLILLTAKSQREDLIHGIESGADDYLTKPFDRDELRVRLGAAERVLRLQNALAEQNRQLREAQASLVQNEKFASVGQLAIGVANEINAPIAEVGESLTVLRRDMFRAIGLLNSYRETKDSLSNSNPDLADAIEEEEREINIDTLSSRVGALADRSLACVHRVRETIRNLRDFAHLDDYTTREFSVDSAVEDVLNLLQRDLTKKRLDVKQVFEKLDPIQGNPGKVKKVLLNILLRGIEAAQRDGSIEVRTRLSSDGGTTVEIQDDGAGIAPDDLKHIFEPFYPLRLLPDHQNGLGLAISYNIVREHGGNIEVTSHLGKGTTFRVHLPKVARAVARAKESMSQEAWA
jgi:signal transduction histidine kinase